MAEHGLDSDCKWSFLRSTYWPGNIPTRSTLDTLKTSIAGGCKLCEAFYEKVKVCRVCLGFDRRSLGSHQDFPYEMPFEELKKSARDGCQDCQILEEGLVRAVFDQSSATDLSHYRIALGCKSKMGDSLPVYLQFHLDRGGEVIKEVEFYSSKANDMPNHEYYAIRPGRELSPQLDLHTALNRTLEWLQDCDENHADYSDLGDTKLPTRVLDLGQDESGLSVVLVESKGASGKYLTLSHCWGAHRPSITTRTNFEERKKRIPIAEFPKLFKDAVSFARGLGVRYLWIDSLCIIQSDAEDWAKEAGKMAGIYAGSYLNIAGAGAKDSTGQLFSTTSAVDERRRGPKAYYLEGRKAAELGIFACRVEPDIVDKREMIPGQPREAPYVNKAPLLSRAWVLQERLLSPRTVYFHTLEMVWDCKSKVRCECGHIEYKAEPSSYSDSFYIRPNPVDTSINLANQWENVVTRYSRLKLTQKKDKLPALSGMAAVFAQHSHNDYVAGIWAQDLSRAVFWQSLSTPGRFWRRSSPYRAPTWSWASLDAFKRDDQNVETLCEAPIRFAQNELKVHRSFRIISAKCESSTENVFGEVSNGDLVVEGAGLAPKRFLTGPWANSVEFVPGNKQQAMSYDLEFGGDGTSVRKKMFSFSLDFDFETGTAGDDVSPKLVLSDLRFLIISYKQESRVYKADCLILRPAGSNRNIFERIGMGSFSDYDFDGWKLADMATVETFHIV